MKIKNQILALVAASLLVTLVTWLPFVLGLNEGMATVFKDYDGPNYLIIAKTWYNQDLIRTQFSLPTPVEYYPAHLPGYPLTIALFDFFLPGPWAMLISTLTFTALTIVSFYLLLEKFKLSENSFWLSLVFLVLPARWVAVKAVGSPEPLFIFALLASFYFFKKALLKINHYQEFPLVDLFWAGIFGGLAQITKSPGILLFIGYGVYFVWEASKNQKRDYFKEVFKPLFSLLLIPFSALAIFAFYRIQTGNFLAYFHSGDNFHLVFPPFQGFAAGRSWLGDFWREDMVWQYLLGALTVVLLIKQKLYDLASFAVVFFTATLFVAHRDLARYSLPLVPFSLIAFDKFIQKKEFKIALLIILPAIYLYAFNFIAGNVAPLSDWAPYL